MTESEKERAEKIANMQRLVDEGLASGISDETMEDIRARAIREYDKLMGKIERDG